MKINEKTRLGYARNAWCSSLEKGPDLPSKPDHIGTVSQLQTKIHSDEVYASFDSIGTCTTRTVFVRSGKKWVSVGDIWESLLLSYQTWCCSEAFFAFPRPKISWQYEIDTNPFLKEGTRVKVLDVGGRLGVIDGIYKGDYIVLLDRPLRPSITIGGKPGLAFIKSIRVFKDGVDKC